MEENLNIWDFELSDNDRAEISKLDLHRPQMLDTRNPHEMKRVYGFEDHPVVTSLQ